ncbi:MAG TPA: hypothetical protein VFQ30_02495, partial [Ktedonobacteraceae bacterium]|nr:hypothetical protein [Ktedonobacteraceae bacterium]
YAYVGVLAASYSDKSQILIELGRFQEAMLFDEKAFAEIQRCVNAGDGLSQEEVWIYHVNRGRLFILLDELPLQDVSWCEVPLAQPLSLRDRSFERSTDDGYERYFTNGK